ncbi:MAG: discoidin domain-containing protein [Candidatus Omnitrophica bacterium]|nr:discoidin domain-containing protein [Candidatus Omnitrophota bacterium]
MHTLVIEIRKDRDQWRLGAFYKAESMEHRRFSIHRVDAENVRELCSDIFDIFKQTDKEGRITEDGLDELKKSCRLLYDQILSQQVKDEIRKTEATHLIFHIDEQLVHIPWELLHDGADYLCLKFAIGRIVLTSREIHTKGPRTIPSNFRMLALCDPTGDLKKAYEEGIAIRNQLDGTRNKIELDLKTTNVDVKYAMRNIKEYDIFHFAGHARYDAHEPSKSGWVLKDGDLTAEKIMTLGGSPSMPLVVFANACSSGETGEWSIDPLQENKIYGLANSFLLAGVKHYIGTFWKVLDSVSLDFSKEFYRNITAKRSIGESLRFARLKLIERYGLTSLIWASYMLYGDPDDHLFGLPPKGMTVGSVMQSKAVKIGAALLILAMFAGYHFLRSDMSLPSTNIHLLRTTYSVDRDGSVKTEPWRRGLAGNLAFGKKVYSTTMQNEDYTAQYAVDGNLKSRWASTPTDPQWIYLDLEKETEIGLLRIVWEDAFAISYKVQISRDTKRWKTVWKTRRGNGNEDIIDLTGRKIAARYIRLYFTKRATQWGYSLWEFEIYAPLPPNISLNKEAFALNEEKEHEAAKAVDGNMKTGWKADGSADQWIYVDLGKRYDVNMINLFWEYIQPPLLKVQMSDDGKKWLDICKISGIGSACSCINFESPFTARYVRLLGLGSGEENIYSLRELEVRGF